MTAAPGLGSESGSARPGQLWLWLSALLVIAAIVQQSVIGLDTDVSWLLTVGERVLGGQRLYVDIFEVNPPASVLIYLPGIAIAETIGVSAEFATATLVFLLAGASLWMSGRLLRQAGIVSGEQLGPTLCCAVFVVLLLAGACFAQREHIALLTMLPMMAVLAMRMERRSVTLPMAILAGLGGGVTMAIKPHFVLAVAPMFLWLMWRRRSLAAGFSAEAWAAAAVVLAYGLLLATVYSVYLTEAIPLLEAVYLPSRNTFTEVWLSPASLLFLLCSALSLFLARSRLVQSPVALPLLAAVGFAAAMGAQGKGYLNHAYPAVALALFGLALVLAERRERGLGVGLLLLLAGSSAIIFAHAESYPELAKTVRRVAPPQPRILVAGSNLSVGHPVTRWVDGQWVGRRGALWVTGAAVALLDEPLSDAQRVTLARYIDEDRRIFVEDLLRGRPDVVLVPGAIGRDWIASNPDVARAMRPYRHAASAQGVSVMVRQARGSAQAVLNDPR